MMQGSLRRTINTGADLPALRPQEAGILLDSTADPARLKQWRDELAAELDQQRRALTQQTSQRESVAVGASVAVAAGGSVRPSVADL